MGRGGKHWSDTIRVRGVGAVWLVAGYRGASIFG